MRRFGGERMQNIMQKLGWEEGVAIDGKLISKSIENAQKKVEGIHFESRKHVTEYDDVMNKQRQVIYNLRSRILHNTGIRDEIMNMIDDLIEDQPQTLELVHAYDQEPTDAFLVQEFFGTDFSRSYLALQALQQRRAPELWPLLLRRWQEDAHNDYGAHYFFIRLFGSLQGWPPEACAVIRRWLEEAIVTPRPQFMKSKPAAVLAMASFGGEDLAEHWLDPDQTPFWEVRYAALMRASKSLAEKALGDPEPFVVAKARVVLA